MPNKTQAQMERMSMYLALMNERQALHTQALLDAKRLIEEQGWTQYRYSGPEGYCMVGALHRVCQRFAEPTEVLIGLQRDVCFEMEDVVGDFLATWNDKHWRTKAEVLDAFDRALLRRLRLLFPKEIKVSPELFPHLINRQES